MKQSLGKAEKLKSRKLIEQLFSRGRSVKAYPLIAVYLPMEDAAGPHQMGVSVSKRRFKKAVDRNLMKKRIREAYRLNKQTIAEPGSESYALMFIYVKNELVPFAEVEKCMRKLLVQLAEVQRG